MAPKEKLIAFAFYIRISYEALSLFVELHNIVVVVDVDDIAEVEIPVSMYSHD